MAMRNATWLLVAFGLFVGGGACSNGFVTYYHSNLERPIADYPELIPHDGEPVVRTSKNSNEEHLAMLEEGYECIGYSSFQAGNHDIADAKSQACTIRAAVALVTEQYSHTRSGNIPLTTYNTETTYQSGSFYGSSGYGAYSGSSTRQVPHTTNIPYSVDRYDYLATFWVRCRPPVLGVHWSELSQEDRKRYERNKGCMVLAVRKSSPAFEANVLRGDIIAAVDGIEVRDPSHAAELLGERQGKRTALTLLRGAKTVVVQVALNRADR